MPVFNKAYLNGIRIRSCFSSLCKQRAEKSGQGAQKEAKIMLPQCCLTAASVAQ